MQEKMKKSGHTVFNYSDVFFSYHFSDERRCSSMAREHYLVYVYSGEYIVEEGGKTIVARAGDCIFIRRDNRVNMIKQSLGDEPFQGIFLFFKRNFLRKVLHKFEKTDLPLDADRMKKSVVKLPDSPDIKSLFTSMVPYFDSSKKPAEGMMDLKMLEAIYSLLNIDPRFYPALFDFTEPWKIDILDFLNQNYMYELSIEEIAAFTGRSLSTFKRDFQKISDMPPQKWLIKRRLEAAHEMLRDHGKKVSDVYVEVGFKNLSHFSSAFKKEFGVAPSTYC